MMSKTNTIIVVLLLCIVGGIIGGVQLYQGTGWDNVMSSSSSVANVTVVSGIQQITITASQGYSPRFTSAKAHMPTTLTIKGKNAYGCESAVRIPKLGYSKNLGPAGSDTITLPEQKPGSVLNGTCTMGMYNFQIKFE